jgi:hypothetical protein
MRYVLPFTSCCHNVDFCIALLQQSANRFFCENTDANRVNKEAVNYESMIALLPIILFVTTDLYEKVKIRRLKCIRTMRKQSVHDPDLWRM